METIKLPNRKEAKKMHFDELWYIWEKFSEWWNDKVDILEQKEEDEY